MEKLVTKVLFVACVIVAIVSAIDMVLAVVVNHSWLAAAGFSASTLFVVWCISYYYKELKRLQAIGVDASRHHGGHQSS